MLNDLHRILHQFRIENGRIVGGTFDFTPEAVESVDSAAFRLARRSRFLGWLRQSLAQAIDSADHRFHMGYSFDYRPDMNTAWKDAPWLAVTSQMKEMRALGAQHGFGLFMIVFPFADQYRPAYLAADRDYVLTPQRRAAELCTRLGIPCLDLYPVLDETHFEPNDGVRLTADGRQRVAEAVAAFLVERSLTPRAR